jgi:hypothetical protein
MGTLTKLVAAAICALALVNTSTGGQPAAYTITPSINGSGGRISPSSAVSVRSGSVTSFQITPNTGYTATVGGTCGGTLSDNTYTTRTITTDCTVTVAFVQAETVYVKYRGLVDLTGFDCQDTTSSFVNRICYQKKTHYLIVLLGNTYYHYCRIPPSVVTDWLDASSKGQFYNANVKGEYDCRLGGIP